MTREEVLEKFIEIFREEFDDDEIEVNFETSAKDIDEWDSLSHLSLIHEIEREFGIKFTGGEIRGTQNVGELIDALLKHKGE